MHPWFSKNLVYRPIYTLRGEKVIDYSREVHLFHGLPIEKMEQIQWAKLLKLLEFAAANNPYYKNLYQHSGLKISQIGDPGDLQTFPFLTKAAIKKDSQSMISNGNWRYSARKTSGSTGTPMHFVKDRIASAYMDALMYEVYGWHGIKIGDRQARVWGLPLDLKNRLLIKMKDAALNRKRLEAFDISREKCLRFYGILKQFRPKFIYGVVNTICEFGRVVLAEGLDPADLGFKLILTTGENLTPRHRLYLHEVFKAPVVDEYGTTENGIVAFECRQGKLHLMNHNLFLEFIDPQTEKPAGVGEIAEVVITELYSYAFPFIRYRPGDLVRTSADGCTCGIASPVIEEVIGRTSELMVLPDGSRLSSAIVSYAMTKGINKFRTHQKSPNLMEISLLVNEHFRDSDIPLIENKLRTRLGNEVALEIQVVDHLPSDVSGKFREFISDIRPDNSPAE